MSNIVITRILPALHRGDLAIAQGMLDAVAALEAVTELEGLAEVIMGWLMIRHAEVAGSRLYVEESADQPARTESLFLPAISLPLELTVGDLKLLQPAFDLAGQEVALEDIHLQGQWRLTELQLSSLIIQHADWGSLSAQGYLRFHQQWPLDLAVQARTDGLQAWGDVVGNTLDLELDGDLGQLAVKASAAARVESTLEATVNVLDPDLSFQAQLHADWPGELALKELVAVQGATGDVSMQAPLVIELGGGLAQQRLQLQGAAAGLGYAAMDISAAARHQGGHVYLDTVRLEESEELSGPLKTRTFWLSYSRAPDVQALLASKLSNRGEIIIDNRTNTIIVRAPRGSMEMIERMIRDLDESNIGSKKASVRRACMSSQ